MKNHDSDQKITNCESEENLDFCNVPLFKKYLYPYEKMYN